MSFPRQNPNIIANDLAAFFNSLNNARAPEPNPILLGQFERASTSKQKNKTPTKKREVKAGKVIKQKVKVDTLKKQIAEAKSKTSKKLQEYKNIKFTMKLEDKMKQVETRKAALDKSIDDVKTLLEKHANNIIENSVHDIEIESDLDIVSLKKQINCLEIKRAAMKAKIEKKNKTMREMEMKKNYIQRSIDELHTELNTSDIEFLD